MGLSLSRGSSLSAQGLPQPRGLPLAYTPSLCLEERLESLRRKRAQGTEARNLPWGQSSLRSLGQKGRTVLTLWGAACGERKEHSDAEGKLSSFPLGLFQSRATPSLGPSLNPCAGSVHLGQRADYLKAFSQVSAAPGIYGFSATDRVCDLGFEA